MNPVDELKAYLDYYRNMGIKYLDCSCSLGSAGGGVSVKEQLKEIEKEALSCTRCVLHRGRKNVVFGAGDPQADLMFIGEGPGRDEDIKGEPFVGRAGELLTRIITGEKAMNMRREDVYITNVVKCRPPDNRNPRPDELECCRPYIIKQIELISPAVIVTLGTIATQALLEVNTPISRMRGRFREFMGTQLIPTFHPAYLLRNPDKKKDVWEDMQKVMAKLEELGAG